MPVKRILIVEDERVVAEDLKSLVEKMGYAVTGIAASGPEALEKVRAVRPDLVLMDIRIQGPQDGIEVAEHLHAEYDVPVSYLTAYADAPTLERAKSTMPFGYILKPFDARALQTAIELAFHRHEMEAVLGGMDGWHARAINYLPDGVIAIDAEGRVMFMNRAAETLTGWTLESFFGRPLSDIFVPGNESATLLGDSPGVKPGLSEGSGTVRSRLASSLPVNYSRTPFPGKPGDPDGTLIVIKKG